MPDFRQFRIDVRAGVRHGPAVRTVQDAIALQLRARFGSEARERTPGDRLMIDREKVLAVLQKRFPEAPRADIAAAANAIVGLEQEFDLVAPGDLQRFVCEAGAHRFTTHDVAAGTLRLYHRIRQD